MSEWEPPAEFDGYRVLRPLGRGGMGRVFLGQDVLLERPVAIKFIAAIEPDAEHRMRFLQEGRAVARLSHPNVVAIHRVGQIDGRQYLVSEYVRGQGLEGLPKPVPLEELLPIAVGLARGLAAAHRNGILHRDIKPSNAVLSETGEVKLLDFGIASLDPNNGRGQTGDLVGPTLTLEGYSETAAGSNVFLGTPRYMAPEVLSGGVASRRSDVYSLGAVLHELCSGQAPVSEGRRGVPPITTVAPGVHPRLAAVVDRCLRWEPRERFGTADELLDALEQVLPRGRPRLDGTENPYRGLRPFEAENAEVFFGRDSEIRSVLERLRSQPKIVVAGDSGVGKSSLCRAGVLVRLEEGALEDGHTWRTVKVLPGPDPVVSLAKAFASVLEMDEEALAAWISSEPAALARALQRVRTSKSDFGLCLFVDQAEELFTLSDAARASLAGQALGSLEAASTFRLLVAVRGDFLTRLALLPGFGDELSSSLFLVRPLSPEKLREVIVGPVRSRGWSFESEEMVQALIEPVKGSAGGLPLLQFALSELWNDGDPERRVLRRASLEAMGGVSGALASHADAVIAALTPDQRDSARGLLLDLLTSERTRTRRTAAELKATGGSASVALEALVRERLVVVRKGDAEPLFELAHESLAQEWQQLRDWLDAAGEQKRALERLQRAAAEWDRLGRPAEALWRRRQVQELRDIREEELATQEREFLARSRRALRNERVRWGLAVAALPVGIALAVTAARVQSARALGHQVSEKLAKASALQSSGTATHRDALRLAEDAYRAFDKSASGSRPESGPEQLWSLAQQKATAADDLLATAEHEFETARLLRPEDRTVAPLLLSLLRERAELARSFHRPTLAAELENRARLLGEAGPAPQRRVTLKVAQSAVTVMLDRYVTKEGRLVSEPVWPGPRVPGDFELPPGSYRFQVSVEGGAPIYYPFLLAADQDLSVELSLPRPGSIPEGFVYVPEGEFFFGSNDSDEVRSALDAPPQHRVFQRAFLVGKSEVTFGEYLAFLESSPEALKHLPGEAGQLGSIRLRRDAGDWMLEITPGGVLLRAKAGKPLVYPGRTKRKSVDWLKLPVSGIDLTDEEAFISWKRSQGVPKARLCTEREWERAARGADRRAYTIGETLTADQANFAGTYDHRPDAIGPDEVGSHPDSDSPFGIHDLEGNGMERVLVDIRSKETVAKSAAWYLEPALDGRIPARGKLSPTTRANSLGFRLCSEPLFTPAKKENDD